jgi:hypothetical protein
VLQSPADCEPWVFVTSPPPGDDRLAIVCHADVRQHNQTSIWFARERIEHAIDIVKVVSSSCSSAARPQPQPAARQASGSESHEQVVARPLRGAHRRRRRLPEMRKADAAVSPLRQLAPAAWSGVFSIGGTCAEVAGTPNTTNGRAASRANCPTPRRGCK